MALGARVADVLRLVVGEAARTAGVGITLLPAWRRSTSQPLFAGNSPHALGGVPTTFSAASSK